MKTTNDENVKAYRIWTQITANLPVTKEEADFLVDYFARESAKQKRFALIIMIISTVLILIGLATLSWRHL